MHRVPRTAWRYFAAVLFAFCLLFTSSGVHAQPATTEPAAPAAVDPAPDPIGFNGGPTTPLLQPNPYLSGWVTGSADKNLDGATGGTFKPWAGDKPTVEELGQHVSKLYYSMNMVWVLVSGFLVIFMQAGFALVETGLIRAKNAAHTFSMNFLVYGLGMFGFFITGFALMCGGWNGTGIGGPGQLGGLPAMNQMFTIGASIAGDHGWGLFGHTGFCLTGPGYDGATVVMFLYMMAFMDTTATIVTGACCERWTMRSFAIYSIIIGGFIYPIFACWVWGGGWLAQLGYRAGIGHGAVDYAGSGVVHLQGGALAIITAYLIGPRLGKYDANGKIVGPIAPHHIPMVQLGTFILAFGWFGFNAGSSLAATDGRIGMVAVNTMIAGMSCDGLRRLLHVVVRPDEKAGPSDDVQQHARRPRRDHRAVRLRHAAQRPSPSAPSPASWSSGRSSSSIRSASTIRWARAASTASAVRGACSVSACLRTAPTARAGTTSAGTTTWALLARASPVCSTATPSSS